MDPDHLTDLFSEFGPITLRRMFSGYGITADGVNFAMALRSGLIFRVDDLTTHRYDAEGCKPFQYATKAKTVVVQSYRVLPERLYDDPEELAVWAREAVGAARRAKAKKRAKPAKRATKRVSNRRKTSPATASKSKSRNKKPKAGKR